MCGKAHGARLALQTLVSCVCLESHHIVALTLRRLQRLCVVAGGRVCCLIVQPANHLGCRCHIVEETIAKDDCVLFEVVLPFQHSMGTHWRRAASTTISVRNVVGVVASNIEVPVVPDVPKPPVIGPRLAASKIVYERWLTMQS